MYKKNVLHKNEMNEKTTKFLDKFVKRVKAYPPGVCPIAVQLSFLQSSRSQTCGKCVPCRDGLEQVENMMRAILDGKADMDTFDNMVELAKIKAAAGVSAPPRGTVCPVTGPGPGCGSETGCC